MFSPIILSLAKTILIVSYETLLDVPIMLFAKRIVHENDSWVLEAFDGRIINKTEYSRRAEHSVHYLDIRVVTIRGRQEFLQENTVFKKGHGSKNG